MAFRVDTAEDILMASPGKIAGGGLGTPRINRDYFFL